MLERRSFHVGDILAVVMLHDVAPSGPRGYITLIDHLAGRTLTPVQRAAYLPYAREALREQLPDLFYFAGEAGPSPELFLEWLRRRQEEFGEFLVVHQAHGGKDLPQQSSLLEKDVAIPDVEQEDSRPRHIADALELEDAIMPTIKIR